MNCERTKRQLADYAVGGLSRWRRAALAAHLTGCPECRSELALLERTASLLATIPDPVLPGDLWNGVASRLEAAERAALPRSQGSARRVLVYAGAVALVLIAVASAPRPHRPAGQLEAPYLATHHMLASFGALGDPAVGDVVGGVAEGSR